MWARRPPPAQRPAPSRPQLHLEGCAPCPIFQQPANAALALPERTADNSRVSNYDQRPDLVEDLLAPLPRTTMVSAVQAVLGVTNHQAEQIVTAFDEFVSAP